MATARVQLITTVSTGPAQGPRKWSAVVSNRKAKQSDQKHRTTRLHPDATFRNQLYVVMSDEPRPVITVDSRTENLVKFRALVDEWRKERGARSSITEAAMMPAYQKIIGMGEAAVPLLLNQLDSEGNEPDQWFWALKVITGANPVKPEDQGNFRKMACAWLGWGRENVYVYVR